MGGTGTEEGTASALALQRGQSPSRIGMGVSAEDGPRRPPTLWTISRRDAAHGNRVLPNSKG